MLITRAKSHGEATDGGTIYPQGGPGLSLLLAGVPWGPSGPFESHTPCIPFPCPVVPGPFVL